MLSSIERLKKRLYRNLILISAIKYLLRPLRRSSTTIERRLKSVSDLVNQDISMTKGSRKPIRLDCL